MSRFTHVDLDDQGRREMEQLRSIFKQTEMAINALGPMRPVSRALSRLEEVYFWGERAVRERQLKRDQTFYSEPVQPARIVRQAEAR